MQVCEAVQHAHQKGIIHRDIKPKQHPGDCDNGDRPVPKVIDFGIAKATNAATDRARRSSPSIPPALIGTPEYMSPEQADMGASDIDTRTDIYSLGVLLYELLTGRPPLDARILRKRGFEEMLRVIREDEPPKPSTRIMAMGDEATTVAEQRRTDSVRLTKTVRGDLDWIVMKALEKDRDRRYETANAFAMDIQRCLDNETVLASPPSTTYRLKKFVHRHKAPLAAAAAVFAVLVAGVVVSTWQAIRATQAEREMAAERDAKERARRDSEDIAKFLGDILRSPDPTRNGRDIRVVDLLDTAASNLESSLADQPARRARLRATLGLTYGALGLHDQAVPLLEEVRDYHSVISGPDHRDTIEAMHHLAWAWFQAGRLDDALELQEEVLTLCRRVFPPEAPATLEAMSNLAGSYHATGGWTRRSGCGKRC